MGQNCITASSEVSQAVQGTLVRMAGSKHQEDGVESGGGGEASAHGQADANTVENYSSFYWSNSRPVFGALRAASVSPDSVI